jgi:hypothetical protein
MELEKSIMTLHKRQLIKSQNHSSRAEREYRKPIMVLSLYIGSVLVLMAVTLIQSIR